MIKPKNIVLIAKTMEYYTPTLHTSKAPGIVKSLFGYIVLLLHFKETVCSDTCSTLTAEREVTNYLNSHSQYGQQDYAVREDRCWQISAFNASYVVEFAELDFGLEYGGSSCIYDYLAIFDGPSGNAVTSPGLGVYCGSSGPGTVYSTQQYMTVKFQTDATFQDKGFLFAYKSIHRDDVPNPPFTLSTAAIIGIVACSLLTFLIIGIVVVICIKQKNQKVHSQGNAGVDRNNQRNYAVSSYVARPVLSTHHGIRTVSGNIALPPIGLMPAPPPYQERAESNNNMEQENQPPPPPPPALPPIPQPPPPDQQAISPRTQTEMRINSNSQTQLSNNFDAAFASEAFLPGYFTPGVDGPQQSIYALPPDIPYPASPPPAYTPRATPR